VQADHGHLLFRGFLGPQGDAFAAENVSSHRLFFEVFSSINERAYEFLVSIEVERGDRLRNDAATLFGRLLESCQAVVLLSCRGLEQDAACLVRVSLEALLRLMAGCEKRELAQKVIEADVLERLKLVNLAIEGKAGTRSLASDPELEARKDELEKLRDTRCSRRVSTEEIARNVGQLPLYNTVYRLTSKYVHLSPRALEEYLDDTPDGKLKAMKHGPTDRKLELHLFSVSEFLLIGMSVLRRHLNLPEPDGFQDAISQFKRLKTVWPKEEDELGDE